MHIARQKREENIAEYILYMYQVEDLIRAYNFDVDAIMEKVVEPQVQDDGIREEYRQWYGELIRELKSGNHAQKGHLPSLREIMIELSYLHNTLLTVVNDKKYKGIVDRAVPYIEEFRQKSGLKSAHQIEVAFQAMYMKLLLRLQNKSISDQTEEAFDAMRLLLAYLSGAYKKMRSGDLDFLKN